MWSLHGQDHVDFVGFILALPSGDLALIWRALAELFCLLRSGGTVECQPALPRERAIFSTALWSPYNLGMVLLGAQ